MKNVVPAGKVGDRFVATFLAVTLVLFFALVGLVIFLVVRVTSVANLAQSTASQNKVLVTRLATVEAAAHTSSIQQCQIANTTRVQDIAIWNRLLDTPSASPAQAAEIAELNHLVKVKDTPRDCAAAYSPSPKKLGGTTMAVQSDRPDRSWRGGTYGAVPVFRILMFAACALFVLASVAAGGHPLGGIGAWTWGFAGFAAAALSWAASWAVP